MSSGNERGTRASASVESLAPKAPSSPNAREEIEERSLIAADGTRIAYQVRGRGPAVVLANGLGGTYTAWRHQYALLGERYRVISWDYRGLFGSGRPADLASLAMERQADDLRCVLDAEEVDSALLMGWSMGVQVIFEFCRQFPERVAGLVACSGTAGRPFDGVLLLPQLGALLPAVLKQARRGAPLVGMAAKTVSSWRGLIPLMERLGMVAPSLDRAVFDDIAEAFGGLDFEAYIETFRQLGMHDCRDSVGAIEVPTLVVCGTKDMLTPEAVARDLVARIPGAELALVEGGTHYVAVEFPQEVNARLETFLDKHYPARALGTQGA